MKAKIELIKDGRPVVIEQADNGVITIQYILSDVDESGRTQVVVIHLTEYVEVIVPHVANEAHVIIGANEHAVARVELSEGVVQALLWDATRCAAGDDTGQAQIIELVPATRTAA